jgi:hypothetical protein
MEKAVVYPACDVCFRRIYHSVYFTRYVVVCAVLGHPCFDIGPYRSRCKAVYIFRDILRNIFVPLRRRFVYAHRVYGNRRLPADRRFTVNA